MIDKQIVTSADLKSKLGLLNRFAVRHSSNQRHTKESVNRQESKPSNQSDRTEIPKGSTRGLNQRIRTKSKPE